MFTCKQINSFWRNLEGVPAHFITTVDEYAEKCLQNTPEYDLENYKKNFKDEVLKMLQD